MKRTIEYAPAYLKKAKKIASKNPLLRKPYAETLNRLIDDPFDTILHTHPLVGNLKGRYAYSLTYELRIVQVT
ncbi:MAG: plasmid stabilization protein [Nitrospirae bacterium]|nr:plasmid stabilization protein [Nitrospirota bacterium]